MRTFLVFGLIVLTVNASAICPLKSYSLNSLASKARSLEKNFQKLTTCFKDSNVQEPVRDIMIAIRKLSYSFSGKKFPGNGAGGDNGNDDDWGSDDGNLDASTDTNNFTPFYGESNRIDLGGLQTEVQRAMEAFFQLSQLSRDQGQNSECSSANNNRNVWIGLIEVFNGFAPMAMASLSKGAPQLSPYLLGAQAVGSVVQQVLKSLQDKAERYSMTSAEKRNAFIDASCLYHDLALNTFVLDETLNTKGNYYEAVLGGMKKERDDKLSEIHNESMIIDVLSQEFRDVSEDLEDFIDFEYAGDKEKPGDVEVIVEGGKDDCDDDGWGDCGNGGGYYDDSTSGNYRETYVCSALKKYFNEKNYGIQRSQRLNVFLSYFRKYLLDKKIRSSSVSYDVNLEILTDALNGLRYGATASCDPTHFERPLKFFLKQLTKTKEKLGYEERNNSLPSKEINEYFSQLKEVSDLSYDVYLVEEKVSFLERIQNENIDIDLGEIYLLESSINSQLVKGQKYSYSWLEFNSNRGIEYLKSFEEKYGLYSKQLDTISNKDQKCQMISKLGRDFRIAKNMRERNILYCNIMYPFVNPVDHPEFASLCRDHGIEVYKNEGSATPVKARRRFPPMFIINPMMPIAPIYLGKKPVRSAAFTNVYARNTKTYAIVEKLGEKNKCGNRFDKESLELE